MRQALATPCGDKLILQTKLCAIRRRAKEAKGHWSELQSKDSFKIELVR